MIRNSILCRICRLTLLFCAGFIINIKAQDNDRISEIINLVDLDSLTETVNNLSGEKEFNYNAGWVFIRSRHKDNPDNQLAAEYLKTRLLKYGLKPLGQDFLAAGQNVYAYKYGLERPHYLVVFCAHFDDMPAGSYAPGADDNASGTAAVVEAARILSSYSTKYSVLFAFWDQEEQGMQGSSYFASQNSIENRDSIIAVINLDMIAFDSNNDFVTEIHTRNIAGSTQLADAIAALNGEYNIGLNTQIINPGTDRSDHSSFWNHGISSVLMIEDFTKNADGVSDFNKYYHQQTDRIDKFNMEYFKANTKLAIAALIHKAGIYDDTVIPPPLYFSLMQNYPNPFNSETTINYSIPSDVAGYFPNPGRLDVVTPDGASLRPVSIKVYDILGREVATLLNELKPPGNYDVKFNAGNLPSGIYFCRMTADSFSSTVKMILLK